MGTTPVPRSREQVLSDLISSFLSEYGIPTLRVGGPLLSLLEAVAQSDVRTAKDVWDALDARSLDNAHGEALDQVGRDESVERQRLEAAYGAVTLSDTGFAKVSTLIHQGRPAPIAGSTTIYVVDGTGFANGQTVYLGRGTQNYEGPLAVSTVVNNTSYWTITLGSPTQRYHAPGESVILAQGGDRTVPQGTVVQTPRTATSSPIQFRTVSKAVIPDGEVSLSNVQVVASQRGSSGNVPAGAISEYSSKPFSSAGVTNPAPYTTGQDREEDDDYRGRIRTARIEKILGTPTAIKGKVLQAVSADEGRRITSASFVRRLGEPSLLVVDDGSGYEEQAAGVAFEQLLDSAAGGEQDVALRSTPVAKAYATSQAVAPFALEDGARLTVEVGGQTYTHTFRSTSFVSVGAATAYEVVASINENPALAFGARTTDGGARVVLYGRNETNESIQVTTTSDPDANDVLVFPTGLVRTLWLYKNDRLLTKDGSSAAYLSNPWASWNTLSGTQTLILQVDGTPAITYSFTDQTFVDAVTGYNSLGKNSPAAWALVFNSILPGVTATTDGSVITLTSNKGSATGAAVTVVGGTLVTQRVFAAGAAAATAADYQLDRSTGQLRLAAALAAGDRLSAGSNATRAFLESSDLGSITLAATASLWGTADSAGQLLTHGINTSTPLTLEIVRVHDWGYKMRLEAFPGTTPTASVFSNVQVGDWLVLWDSAIPAAARGAWRVATTGSVTVGPLTFVTRLHLERRVMRAARVGHRSSALVPVGGDVSRVLVTGGSVGPQATAGTHVAVTSSCEIFTPATSTWSTTSALGTPRAYHTCTTLNDGRVLVVGGLDQAGAALASTEIWSPTFGTWSAGPVLPVATAHHRATKLADGRVLITGGNSGATYRTDAYIFDPGTNLFGVNMPMATARAKHGAVLLSDGRVMVTGGNTTGGTGTATAEIFVPGSSSWSAAASMPSARRDHGHATYSTTQVLVVGDDRAGAQTATYAVYTIASNTWSADTALGATYSSKPLGCVTMHNGSVLAPFGNSGATLTSRLWNGAAWSSAVAPFYADASSLEEVSSTLLYDSAVSVLNRVMVAGGLDPARLVPVAMAEQYDGTALSWSRPDATALANFTLPSVGLSLVRTIRWLRKLTVAAGSNYTASSLATSLSGHPGISATTYRTNRLRVSTNSHDAAGDIMLAAADTTAQALGLTPAVTANQATSAASVVTGESDTTPTFSLHRILEDVPTVTANDASAARLNGLSISAGATLNLAKNHYDGTVASWNLRWGRNAGFRTTLRTFVQEAQATYVTMREAAHDGFVPGDRVWLSSPYALGHEDDLNVLVDGDTSLKRFAVSMYRRVKPATATYGATNDFTDADAANVSMAATFGLNYSFNDFAVFMKSRGLGYIGDAGRSMLFRYYLHGPAGDRARVRVSYPSAASQAVAVSVDATSGSTVDVRASLASGNALTTSNVRGSTKVGVAVTATTNNLATLVYVLGFAISSASRDGANLTTMILDLPTGVTDSGLLAGDTLYFGSTNGNWTAGTVTLASVSAPVGTQQTVTFTNASLGTGVVVSQPTPGTLSNDVQGDANITGSAVAVNDFFRLGTGVGLASNFTGATFRVSAFTAQTITCKAVEKSIGATATTLVWGSVNDAANFQLFQTLSQTATVWVAALNALAAADQSTCPCTSTITGTGASAMQQGTVENLNDAAGWVSLTDGLNYVSHTTLPLSVSQNYGLTFKTPTSAGLATGSDWGNEDVRLVPVTTATVAAWLATPAVTGLFTAASVQQADAGRRVQISSITKGSSGSVQVQSGLANQATADVISTAASVPGVSGNEAVVRVTRASATGLVAGGWVSIVNETVAPKLSVFTSGTVLSSWAADGTLTLSTPVYTQTNANPNVRVHVERQGRYLVISDLPGLNTTPLSLASVVAGDWVRITVAGTPTAFPQASSGNTGVFRVVRVVAAGELAGSGGAVWIENDLGVEEASECNLHTYTADSIMPGDTIQISTPLWGSANQGVWTVQQVGGVTAFTTSTVVQVSTATRSVVPVTSPAAALGTSAAYVQALDSAPATLYKRIVTMSPASDGAYIDVRLDSADAARFISPNYGSTLTMVDKLGFPTTPVLATDAYKANTGLIEEAAKITFGDPSDPAGYPGVAAEGARMVIAGPTVRRIRIALQVRAATGYNREDVAAKVRSAVASVVNSSPVGVALPLSEIVRAAQQVQGVVAVAIVSPAFSAASDVITVSSTEKPLVLDLNQDVTITFLAD